MFNSKGGKMAEKKFDLEDRFVSYTCRMIDVVESLPDTRAGNYLAGQLIRSGHSPTLNYGEAQGAESRSDFIHKMGIVLKELKECRSGLKIIQMREMIKPDNELAAAFKETEELIAITAKSISTARKKSEK